jgi:hypothetical protein
MLDKIWITTDPLQSGAVFVRMEESSKTRMLRLLRGFLARSWHILRVQLISCRTLFAKSIHHLGPRVANVHALAKKILADGLFRHLSGPIRSLRIVRVMLSVRIIIALASLAGVFSVWVLAQFVLAEREANIYVFPSHVATDGWDNGQAGLSQDLSSEAELMDFTRENSSYVYFGTPISETDAPSPVVYPEGETTWSAGSSTPVIEEGTLAPEFNILPETMLDPATETNDASEQSDSAPDTTEVLVAPPIEIVPVELTPVETSPQGVLSPLWRVLARLSSPESALAQDSLPMMEENAAITEPADAPVFVSAPDSILDTGITSGTTQVSEDATTTVPAISEKIESSYDVAVCSVLGKTCHLLEFTGFGLAGNLDDKPLVSAKLEISFAGRGEYAGDAHDRVLVRVFRAGTWSFLGEEKIRGELSNAKRGGYLSFDIPEVASWGDLSDLKVVVEFDRASANDSAVYVDGIWINAAYIDTLYGETANPESAALAGDNLHSSLLSRDLEKKKFLRDELFTPEGELVRYTHANAYPDAKLSIKTDTETYHALGYVESDLSVTNDSADAEVVRLQFHLPEGGARLVGLTRFTRNMPYHVGTLKYDDIGYFCSTGWEGSLESSGGSAGFSCAETGEVRQCNSLNDDKTNCIESGASVGLTEETEYRSAWVPVELKAGSIDSEQGLITRLIAAYFAEIPEDAVPPSLVALSHTDETFLLQSGQSAYFRAKIEVPLNARGDLFVEASAKSGAFGLVHAGWNGSWNWRLPVSIASDIIGENDEFAAPIDLSGFPEDFWDKVTASGNDLRFVDEAGASELPYWLSSWSKADKRGIAWVRFPNVSAKASTTVYAYFGDPAAGTRSDHDAPFRSTALRARALLLSSGAGSVSVHAVALADDVSIAVGGDEPKHLKHGESALFSSLEPNSVFMADGPANFSAIDPTGRSTVVPLGYLGEHFVAPAMVGPETLSIASVRDTEVHGLLTTGESEASQVDVVPDTTVSVPVSEVTSSVRYDAENAVIATLFGSMSAPTPLYPAVTEELYGFTTGMPTVGVHDDASDIDLYCGNSSQSFDGRRAGMSVVFDHCASGPLGSPEANAARAAKLTKPVALFSANSRNISAYLPRSEFSPLYILPANANVIALLCAPEDGEVLAHISDPQGNTIASSTCKGSGSYAGKVVVQAENGTVFPAGSVISTLTASGAPFLAAFENEGGNIVTLHGAPLSRFESPNHPEIFVGAPEFVVPGEHRVFDKTPDEKEKPHVNDLLSNEREFTVHELPSFRFHYKRQSSSITQGLRDTLGFSPFRVESVELIHRTYGKVPFNYDVTYGDSNDWTITLKKPDDPLARFHPGEYTLRLEINEGGTTHIDEFDFFWGVLAINYERSVYTPYDTVQISMAALSANGNTICDANLKLWIADPSGVESEVPVSMSGKCKGNNIVDVPDYSATYTIPPDDSATGTYKVKLVRLDPDENVASQVVDELIVRDTVPVLVERYGPTRIYPIAHYPMHIRVTAHADFTGSFVERVPGDFVIIDRGNADLEWGDDEHSYITASWPLELKAGESAEFTYTFDAPNLSPYLYLIGPAEMRDADDEVTFTEAREWQVASDAAGKMLLFYDGTQKDPTGWTCVSCDATSTYYQRLPFGSSTAGLAVGASTTLHAATAIIYQSTSTGGTENDTTNTLVAFTDHQHTMTPTIAATSSYPRSQTLRIIQSNSAGEPTSIPEGAIGFFNIASSSLPSNWYRYAMLDGYYAVGENSFNVATGSNTHYHAVTGSSSVGVSSQAYRSRVGGTQANPLPAPENHTHQLSATSTTSINNEPPYIEALYARLTSTSSPPNYLIAMWDNDPADQWVTLSGEGGAFSGRFVKASTTYGGTGGASDHTHADILSGITGISSASTIARTGTIGIPNTHMHQVDITGFSTDSHTPPYREVIFAERLNGISVFTQDTYRFYANNNGLNPTDPWPTGASDYSENEPVITPGDSIKPTDKLRIRMNVQTTNSTTTVGMQAFKLQYVASNDCPNALNWTDVSHQSSSTALWRGFDNSSVSNNATITSMLLSSSTVAEAYVEQNSSTTTLNQVGVRDVAEWDWVIQDNAATNNTNYCFRMVKSDGTPLDSYVNYPSILTNASPSQMTQAAPFDNEKVSTTTPYFKFYATDPEFNDLDYEIQIDTSATFTAPIVNKDSSGEPDLFLNLTDQSNKAPFISGHTIQFQPTTALAGGTTYWWRVRAKDSNGSNGWGPWSSSRSFTVDTLVSVSTWFQTTRDQFQLNTLFNTNASSVDRVMITSGSNTGTMTSPTITFSDGTLGNAWGNLKFTDVETSSDVKYSIEYFTSTSSWALIPDTDLSGNGAGFDSSSVSLLSVDPTVYSSIRVKANLTDQGQTPIIDDWTVEWGYAVNRPTLYTPFDNQKVATRTPAFEFMTTDPQSNDLLYEIQWSTTSAFTSSTTRNSQASSTSFVNTASSTDTSPFISGDRIRFTPVGGDTLASSTTYFWRVRARDPGGADVWSLWSATRSLTPDTTVTIPTWFQTVNDQFNTDTLNSMYTYSNGSTTVSTTTDEVLVAYGEGVVQTPRYRFWDGTSLGSELSAQSVGAAIHWVITRSSPLISQYIMGTLGSDKDINFQVYDGSAWGNLYEGTSNAPSVTRRSFDVVYETISGRALAVYCDNGSAKYRIWDGSAWAATGTISLTSGGTECEWIRLASSPAMNQIVGVFRNTGNRYEAQVWNGTTSSWGNSTVLGSMTEVNHEGMAIEYEASGYQAVLVTSNANNNNMVSKFWSATSSAWNGTTTVALGDDFEWGNLRRAVATDTMMLCYVDHDSDIGVQRWDGSQWLPTGVVELETAPTAQKEGRNVDCAYETMTQRSGYWTTIYSDVNNTGYRFLPTGSATWQGERLLATTTNMTDTFTDQLARTSASGTLTALLFDTVGLDYVFAAETGSSSWTNIQVIEDNPSVTATPYGEPFYMAAKLPVSIGTINSTAIDFDDGGAPAWDKVTWDATTPGSSSFKVQIEYQTPSGTWSLVPDTDLAGNSSGTSTQPYSIRNLDTTTYNVIRLKGTATCLGVNCPTLNDWTLQWAAGIKLSGVARQHNLTSNVTSGTVAVAVNGSLKSQTGTIDAGGNWFIDNVTAFNGNTVTVFVDSPAAQSNRAATVVKYSGTGDLGGMRLNEHWLTIGSASTTGQVVSLTDIGRYDNTNDSDIFYDVTAGGDYNNCASGTCTDAGIYVYSNTFRPSTSTPKTITTFDMKIDAYMYADTNTIKVAGDWTNSGGFTSNASTIVMNGTSSTHTINQTGAATSTFFNLTIGDATNAGTTTLSSDLTATGTVSINFGTTSPETYGITLQGDLTFGSSGGFMKGAATTTFSGSLSKTWTDNTSAKQDLGNILVDGNAKVITLGSSVKATSVKIGTDDNINAGGANTFTVLGFWQNGTGGTFTAQTGTVMFATTTTALTIDQGTSNFYNLTFNGTGGSWRWLNTNATATNNLTISAGTVTMPGGTLAVGSNFDNSGGAFMHNDGVVRMYATVSGKNVRAGGSSFKDLVFAGSGGGWTFLDTNATTTASFIVTAGTPVLPSGTLSVGSNFDIQSGAFTANSGTVRMTSTSTNRTIRLSGSPLANLFIASSTGALNGTFSFSDTNATATGALIFAGGTTTFPTSNIAVGGDITVQGPGVFDATTSMVHLNPQSGTSTITASTSRFHVVDINPAAGATVNIAANATATGALTIISGTFVQSTSTNLEVLGIFTNRTGGASTTWTGSKLYLNSGTNYTINTKTTGFDSYNILKQGANMQIRSWGSSAGTYELAAGASVYSQNHSGTSGEVDIFGSFTNTSTTEYWSADTDFDGTLLATTSRRAVSVRFENGASALFSSSSSLQIVGTSTATTSINVRTSGSYALLVSSSTINANYYSFRNMDANGLSLFGSTTITSLSYGDFGLDATGGSSITIASTTILQNNGLQIFTVRFALASAASGFNVAESGSTPSSNFIRFKQHYGGLDGEALDVDAQGNPGNIRWDDSQFIISVSGTVYSDAGVTRMTAPTCDGVTPVVSVKVNGQGNFTAPCAPGPAATGTFTISSITFQGDAVFTVFLATSTGPHAVNVTRSAVADMTGIDLYQNRVIVRHEDSAAMTIAKMNAYDSGQDPSIPFLVSTSGPDTLTVNPETEFWIWNSKTFVPSGNITLQSGGSGANYDGTFHVDNNATFTGAGTESHSVGGRFAVDAGGTFTSASTTFTFTATTSGKVITAVSSPVTFWKMIFNGSGGNWSINQNVVAWSDLTMTAGTLSGVSNVNVRGTNVTGAGTIAMTGGTFTLENGGMFGGTVDWSFNNLYFGTGTVATTSKTASSSLTVSGGLSIAVGHILEAGTSTTWILTGGGTPFTKTGTFIAESSVFRYAATTNATATPADYYRLEFSSSGVGTPVFGLNTGVFTVGNDLIVGNSSNALTVNANIADPTLTVFGNTLITTAATFVGSNSAAMQLYGNWTNQGTFTHSLGTAMFVATTTGKTIDAGNSSFGSVLFQSTFGGWTITQNATSASNFTIASGTLALAQNRVLEVNGAFSNQTGGASTTWATTTLYLNSGTSFTINASTTADIYGELNIGANTSARIWNSSAATTTVNSTGALYSQDHNGTNGLLQIWGSYVLSSGNDYWSYATDFDGTTLSGGARRAVSVRIASSSSVAYSGGTLNVLGDPTASTSIDVLGGSGAYAFAVSGGGLSMQYYSVRHTDSNGINISGTPNISELSDGDLQLDTDGGTLIKVAGATIDANPLKTFFRQRFATSSGIATGTNVTATGVSASAWRFNLTYGNRAGEAFDNDPAGDPGYLIWDDSAANITVSGRVFADEGVTPIGNPVCNGVSQNIRLKVQGAGTFTSACNNTTGAYSISNIVYNPLDTITVFIDMGASTTAANIMYDPVTNINNADLYLHRVIVRHEQSNAVGIKQMATYDYSKDPNIPFTATTTNGTATTTTVFADTGLIVWSQKTFTPGGNVTLAANASANSWEGSVSMYATSTWTGAAGETYTVGGNFFATSGASISAASSLFNFTATTSGKMINASSALAFYDLTFSGANGTWLMIGVATTSNNLTISAGTTTLPSSVLNIGGSFDANGARFMHNGGTLNLYSTASGKTVHGGGSTWNNLTFSGAGGGWNLSDTNATTSGSVNITAGTPILPVGIFAVGTDFNNQSGSFTAGASSTLKMTATSSGRTIKGGGSSFGGLFVENNGIFSMNDAYATATGDVIFKAGTTTLATTSFAMYQNFTNNAVFDATTSTMYFVATSGAKTVNTGSSSMNHAVVNGAGVFTFSANATTTGNFTIQSAGSFTKSSGTILAVGGQFINQVGGNATTWSGSTLKLYSGTTFAINAKTTGGDAYATLELASGTRISAWNSTSSVYTIPSTAHLYSQDHNSVDGALYIFGGYQKTSGTDHWSAGTDFDGTALAGAAARAVNVRFAASANAFYATATALQIVGTSTASTSIDRQSTGNYGIELQSATLDANYYQLRNLGAEGLKLTGTTTITSLNNGDFELNYSGGSLITIASTTIDQNASSIISRVHFATSSGISGANVTRIGTTTNSITFSEEYGNYASEAYDNDGNDGCGSMRFTDSSCLISDQRYFRWRNDDGGEGAPASEWYSASWSKRQRVRVYNNSASAITNAAVQLWVTYDSDMQSDFDDIRFTDSGGVAPLSQWMEAYSASASSSWWVKLPLLPASSYADLFMYYGNSGASASSTGTTTFTFFDDFEDASLSEYSGDTSLFEQSTSFNYERTRGLDASAGNEGAQNTDGIGQVSAGVGRDNSIRFHQYIDMSSGGSDEPCFLFAIQSPITNNQNYAVCLQPFGTDKVKIAKNASWNGRASGAGNDAATELAVKTVTFSTGWYRTDIDWLSSGNQINVSVYDSNGALFATTSATDSSYTSGGIGFTFWGQHGGWDIPFVRPYIATTSLPSQTFFVEQANSGATWKSAENIMLSNLLPNQNVRLRIAVKNSGAALNDQNFRLQVASKGVSANCESVPAGNYTDVTTTSGAGCGASAACMIASSQFTDKASTTQLLTIPSAFGFDQGQIMEDPSNQSGNVSVASARMTEVEYNFQMTSFAVGDRYCFRTTNAGTALDNYTKVAELSMLHPPTISNWIFNSGSTIALTEGTTTRIYATGTVTDLNGYADIIAATSTYYRSSVSGGRSCTADENSCYVIPSSGSSSCELINCSGNSCTVSCSAYMQYFADPTDPGSLYAADNWLSWLDVWDSANSHASTSDARELYTMSALSTTSTIPYGSITVGNDSGAYNATTTIRNTGNSILNLNLYGDDLRAGVSSINVNQQKYSTSTFTYASCGVFCTALATSTNYYSLGVAKPTSSTTAQTKDIYWGLNVPLGSAATSYFGSTTLIGTQ